MQNFKLLHVVDKTSAARSQQSVLPYKLNARQQLFTKATLPDMHYIYHVLLLFNLKSR